MNMSVKYFPQSEIIPNCINEYPIKVTIEAQIGKTNVKVWEGSQRNLFRKYASKRAESQEEMKQHLSMLKSTVESFQGGEKK